MTTTDNISEGLTEQQYIKLFSQRIIRERTGNFHSLKKTLDGKIIFPSIDSKTTTNRGNKLLQGVENVSRKRMFNEAALNEDTIYYNGSEHKLLHRKRMRFFPPGYENGILNSKLNEDEQSDDDEEMDLHKLVNFRDILTPIASLSDVVKKKSVSRTFQNKIINDLSLKTILMIEKEQSSVNRYSKLLDVFLGDYPKPLYESTLKLKDYDHNLTLPEEEEEDNTANTTEDKDIRDAKLKEVINPAEEDPFFALPQLSNKDGINLLAGDNTTATTTTTKNVPNNDISITEQMELTRQMTQIALQRNEEFIRNLLKIRNFLDKSTRIRERVLAWGKESAGVQDEGVTVPNVLRVVKRGLISISANKIVNDGHNNEDGVDNVEDTPANDNNV
ncbi:transcriptional regulatory protein Rxt2p [Monosporozyma unispora]|nr:histone deacetylase complex subunit Rxt2 [Kazachstania unispora]